MATTILCYGDSNTWGWVPGKLGAERFGKDIRWPGLLQQKLGSEYVVLEDALGARNTACDDPRPELPLRNGLTTLPISLEIHTPVDIVIFMLGTADCKEMQHLTPPEIANGMEKLIQTTQSFKTVNGKSIQHIVLVAPPVVDDSVAFCAKLFTGGTAKGKALVELYKQLATRYGCTFVDSNPHVKVDADEGIHITPDSHARLSEAVLQAIKSIG